jgi:heme A synthase
VYRFAVATAAATFVLLLVGGIVHGTGSSLACPDWPLCYGSAFPEMTGGVLFEHSHRLLATGVGIMTIVLTVLCWRGRERADGHAEKRDRALGPLATVALVAVIVQGVLGGITVLLRLPTAVSTAHLALSMAFFSLLIYIAWRARPGRGAPGAVSPSLHRWILVATLLVYVQIVIGGLVRHTGAGLACLDVPLCAGELWPVDGPPQAKLQMIHRFVGAAVGLLVIVVAVKTFLATRGSRAARWLSLAAPLLVLVQVTLGVLSVLSMLGLWQVTAHLGVGALLLGNLWLLSLITRPARAPAPTSRRELVEAGT